MEPFEHVCEVCGNHEMLTSDEAFKVGWDYPPHVGAWGVVSPRTCPNCPLDRTLWSALVVGGDLKTLPPEEWPVRMRATLERILAESRRA